MLTKSLINARWHEYWAFRDEEFWEAISALPPYDFKKQLGSEYLDIGSMFGLPWSVVMAVHINPEWAKSYTPELIPGVQVRYDEGSGEFEIGATEHVTRQMWDEAWVRIQQIKVEKKLVTTTRQRPADNTQLLYAIFRARKAGNTWQAIFDACCSGVLQNYPHKLKAFITAESMRRYYAKHYTA
jgi:hypothetical protein